MEDDGGGLSTGAIVGIVIGIVALVLIAVGIFLFWFLRRRKQHNDDYQDDPSVRGSSSGMMGSHHPEMSMSGGSPGSPGSAGNRNSMLQIDPRMDPFKQAYGRNSTESVNTLRDDHDYSRRIQQPKVLRATNPDP
jgi:cell wall integrity and stress response component